MWKPSFHAEFHQYARSIATFDRPQKVLQLHDQMEISFHIVKPK